MVGKDLKQLFDGADIQRDPTDVEGAMVLANAGIVYSKAQVAAVKARLWVGTPDDPRHDEARQILECVEKLKALAARDLPVYGTLEKITSLVEAAEAKITGPLAEHGKNMKGRRKGKVLSSTLAIDAAIATLGRDASWKEILNHIEAAGVCRIEDDRIVWADGRATKQSGFPNRVSEQKKRIV